jgi:hypothetical protein
MLMVKDTLNSILDNIKERTTNPFLGTLIVVWLVKNWTLVYSLFYFDGSLKLEGRLKYLSNYFANHSFILNMVYVILITLGVLVVTYILLGLSRFLTETYERRLVPQISKWTDKSSVVLKVDYLNLQEVVKQLEIRLETERLAKVSAQNERDEAYSKLVKDSATSINEESPDLLKIYNDAKDESPPPKAVDNPKFTRVASILKRYTTDSSINSTFNSILNRDALGKKDHIIQLLQREELISLVEELIANEGKYIFSSEGLEFLRFWNNVTYNLQDE